MKLEAIDEPKHEKNTPIVARFATIRYDLPSGQDPKDSGRVYASIPLVTWDDTTHPTTYSATTKRGDDNDSDDKGED